MLNDQTRSLELRRLDVLSDLNRFWLKGPASITSLMCYEILMLVKLYLRTLLSTVRLGLLNSEDLMCSSTSFGVTQITCWPFQYLT